MTRCNFSWSPSIFLNFDYIECTCIEKYLKIFFLCVSRQGSVVADVDLNFAENATDVTPDTLNKELPNSGQMGNLTYDPQSAKASGS